MTRLTILILLVVFPLLSYGQIAPELDDNRWREGRTKTIYGTEVLRIEGRNRSGIQTTNIGYQSMDQSIAEVEKRANQEMWTDERRDELIEIYETLAPGGRIHLYVERLTLDAANLGIFQIIIHNANDDEEIYREELRQNIPNRPSGNTNWWNYTAINLPEYIFGDVFIYVVEPLTGNYKFKITI